MKNTFEPAIIGGIEVKNRIFRSATYGAYAVDNKPSQKTIELYENLSKGDVGLIIFGYAVFSSTDHYAGNVPVIKDDTMINLKKVTDTVHQYGTKIVAQINHSGAQLFAPPEGPVYGPSEYVDPLSGITATAFSIEQIKEFVKEFGKAALISKEAGFDGVQIHGAHGYLLSKFLSPTFNKRTDEYGGDTKRNMQIVVDIFKEIKTTCGKDFPVWIKLNSSDFETEDKGLTEEEFLVIGEELSKVGMDAIEVSGGTATGFYSAMRSLRHSAYHLESAKKLSEKVDSSVILVGGIRDVDTIDSILEDTKIEGISISRALVKEPGLVKRWQDGDRSPAKCVACNGCLNFKGLQCYFDLSPEEQEEQKPIMKMMQSKN
ncbi:NADH:flavin oxidoreductase [Ilyobacter sp.]|uniref:NADH:flavin oxidoreductase n=1 Tax=Ilyobacter sp. TaxID=3100343 RepID=UPI0035679F2F